MDCSKCSRTNWTDSGAVRGEGKFIFYTSYITQNPYTISSFQFSDTGPTPVPLPNRGPLSSPQQQQLQQHMVDGNVSHLNPQNNNHQQQQQQQSQNTLKKSNLNVSVLVTHPCPVLPNLCNSLPAQAARLGQSKAGSCAECVRQDGVEAGGGRHNNGDQNEHQRTVGG